jgi:hypothetical protein
VDFAFLDLHPPLLELGKREEVLDNGDNPVGIPPDDLEVRPVFLFGPGNDRLDETLDGRQRRLDRKSVV